MGTRISPPKSIEDSLGTLQFGFFRSLDLHPAQLSQTKKHDVIRVVSTCIGRSILIALATGWKG